MDFNDIEVQIQNLINAIRADPKSIVPDLQAMLPHFNGKYFKVPGTKINIVTDEGKDAVIETIEQLQHTAPLPPMKEAQGMYFAARDHSVDIGNSGAATHEGSDGSRLCDRIDRYGDWDISIAENIIFDDYKPKTIVFSMLIDDGNASRGHRNNILSPDFKFLGVAVNEHSRFKFVTVVTFAVNFNDKSQAKQQQPAEEPVQRKTSIQQQGFQGGSKKAIISVQDNPQSNTSTSEKIDAKQFKPPLNKEIAVKSSAPNQEQRPHPPFNSGHPDMHGIVANWRLDPDAPPNAVNCVVKRFIKRVNNKKIVRVLKIFTLSDGSQEEVEEYSEETS